ncbi:hypothetical protein [Magnetofaba australis]|uniref:Uncharacterized protein n=1 Tax=Magnetofaba australis IT-1 TaxID=1434232 RepID=A0A1Y2K9T8_9PROT|nr:hypothetical protein [Magnetofaba australis]OSM07709.1 hypothetical protein MAIT1_04520 [Magnetofaba australis IT-1]
MTAQNTPSAESLFDALTEEQANDLLEWALLDSRNAIAQGGNGQTTSEMQRASEAWRDLDDATRLAHDAILSALRREALAGMRELIGNGIVDAEGFSVQRLCIHDVICLPDRAVDAVSALEWSQILDDCRALVDDDA